MSGEFRDKDLGGWFDDLAEKSLSAASVAEAKAHAGKLVTAAESGGFHITPEGADELIRPLRAFLDRLEGIHYALEGTTQRLRLGSHDYGRHVADRLHEAANGPNSAPAVVGQLKEVLRLNIEALLRASNQYDEAEQGAVDAAKKAGLSALNG